MRITTITLFIHLAPLAIVAQEQADNLKTLEDATLESMLDKKSVDADNPDQILEEIEGAVGKVPAPYSLDEMIAVSVFPAETVSQIEILQEAQIKAETLRNEAQRKLDAFMGRQTHDLRPGYAEALRKTISRAQHNLAQINERLDNFEMIGRVKVQDSKDLQKKLANNRMISGFRRHLHNISGLNSSDNNRKKAYQGGEAAPKSKSLGKENNQAPLDLKKLLEP